jgi:Tol biopolymer transport system component
VQDTDRSNSRALSKGGRHSSPAWAPDGSRVAFLRIQRTGTEVVIVTVDGGDERVVSKFDETSYGYDNRMLDWSPDGRRLVVSRGPALYLVDIENSQEQILTHPGPAVTGDVDPRFSPDGTQISFIRLIHRAQQEIFTIPAAGGTETQVTKLARHISSHDWMRDRSSLVFASDRDGNYRLWRVRLGSTDGGQSSTPLGVYSEFPIQISAARAADSLVYSALQQDRNIWRLNLQSLEWKRLIASSGQDASPQYSPTADRICFRSDRSGEEQLWISKADGSEPTQITQGTMRPSVGRWSPDGSSIVFNSPQTGEVWIATENGREWRVRNTGVQGIHPVFSTDGLWIYAGGPAGIVRFPPSGAPLERISNMKSEALALSPDGKHLYFASEPTDTALWRLDLATKATAKVLDGIVPACTSCWALSNDGVYFLGIDRESFDRQVLFLWDFKTSTAKPVMAYPEPLWPLGSGPFSLGPGGNLLVVRVESSNSDVMLVKPFH